MARQSSRRLQREFEASVATHFRSNFYTRWAVPIGAAALALCAIAGTSQLTAGNPIAANAAAGQTELVAEQAEFGAEPSTLANALPSPLPSNSKIDGLTRAEASLNTFDKQLNSLQSAGSSSNSSNFASEPLRIPSVSRAEGIETVEVENKALEIKTVRKPDASMERGEEKVSSAGTAGSLTTTYQVVRGKDGQEISRHLLSQVESPGQPKVIMVGTKGMPEITNEAEIAAQMPVVVSNPTGNVAIGQEMAAGYGWTGGQFQCLVQLWNHESGWRTTAGNQSSGAYGIPQSLPGSKMAAFGADWRTNPRTQIAWGLSYIAGRYGTPCGAWSHFQSRNWY